MKNAVGRCGNRYAKARVANSARGLFPSKKKKKITGKMSRCCCGLNNERVALGFPSPLIISYRQHGGDNILDTKTSGAASPRSLRGGGKNEACVA